MAFTAAQHVQPQGCAYFPVFFLRMVLFRGVCIQGRVVRACALCMSAALQHAFDYQPVFFYIVGVK
jgi:hypothetical protein